MATRAPEALHSDTLLELAPTSVAKEARMRRTLVVLFACSLAAGPAWAEELTGTLKKIRDSQTIALGHWESARPFSYVAADGKPTGYSVDLCTRIAAGVKAQLGLATLQVRWVAVDAESRFRLVVNGTIDLECGTTTNTLSRQEQVDFSNMTFVDGGSLLATDASRIQGLVDLAGHRVAVIPNTTTETRLAEALAKRGVKTTVVKVKDHTDGLAALESGRADAYASDKVVLIGLGRTAKDPLKLTLVDQYFSYEPYGFMLRRGDAPFRLAVNRVLARIYRSETEIAGIYQKWFGDFGEPGSLLRAMYILNGLPE
jgi:ABC-type amino acid transport substrate-binding protein